MQTDYVEMEINGKKERMSMYTFVGWACLIEAIETIHEKAKELGVSERDESWIKPSAIQKYVEDRRLSLTHQLETELQRPTFSDFRPKRENVLPNSDQRRK